jgi:ankyrin repeat protein
MRAPGRGLLAAGALVFAGACGIKILPAPHGGAREHDLVVATAARDVTRVRQLLSSGADPNGMVDFEGSSHSAWEYSLTQMRTRYPDTIEIVTLMIKAGAKPESAWGGGVRAGIGRPSEKLPIQIAMLNPNVEVIRALLDAGMSPRVGGQALETAVEGGETEIVHLLVERGVDVNTTAGATTPLLAAIEARNVALMTYLEEHGAREKP